MSVFPIQLMCPNPSGGARAEAGRWHGPWLFEEACACMRSHTHTQKLSPVCVCASVYMGAWMTCLACASVPPECKRERASEEQGRPLLKMETEVARIRGVSVHWCREVTVTSRLHRQKDKERQRKTEENVDRRPVVAPRYESGGEAPALVRPAGDRGLPLPKTCATRAVA